MSYNLRIWLTAIVYQSIIFALTLDMVRQEPALWLFLIPVELLGGLPGLFLFRAALRRIDRSSCSISTKWLYLVPATALCALATTLLTALAFGISVSSIVESGDWTLIYPAPLAALLALLTHAFPLNKYLHENTPERIS